MASTQLIPELNILPPWLEIQIPSALDFNAFFVSSTVTTPLTIIGKEEFLLMNLIKFQS